MSKANTHQSEQPFAFNFIDPYKTFRNGQPQRIPYIIDGLLTQGGLSALGGKSKSGKSSLSRYEAVCVAKGAPFLGRNTVQGEVLLFSLEDPTNHVDNCLSVLGYDQKKHERIRLVEAIAPTIRQNIDALGDALSKMPNVRLVIVDTLAKLIRVDDLNDYTEVTNAVEQLHHLARKFPHLHIQGTAHCKKLRVEDPFDGLLGSTALRAEPDTNLVIYGEGGQRIFASETRIGRNIPPTLLHAELVESAGANVVSDFRLDVPLVDWQRNQKDRTELKRKASHEERIITYLQSRDNLSATKVLTLDEVEGKDTYKLAAIDALAEAGVITITGKRQSATDPLTLKLNPDSLRIHDFIYKFDGRTE